MSSPLTIPNYPPCEDRREVRPSYDDLLYEAMEKLRKASDHRSQFGTRQQDEAFRNSLLNDVKDLISEAQERLSDLANARDNLARARNAALSCDPKEQWGQSGQTLEEIIAGYERWESSAIEALRAARGEA